MRKYTLPTALVALSVFTLYTGGFFAAAQQIPTFDSRWVFPQAQPALQAPAPAPLSQTAPKADPTPAPAPAPAPASDTMVSLGTLAASILEWLKVAFGSTLGAAGTALLVRLFQAKGRDISAEDRARLNEGVNNAIAWAAHQAGVALDGKLSVNVKSKLIADAIGYVERHLPDTLAALGAKAGTPAAANAITARAAVILGQPVVPSLPPPLEPQQAILTTADAPARAGNTRVVRRARRRP